MSILYLTALLVSAGCVTAVDARYRLFLWRAPLRAGAVLLLGTGFFLAWDLAGIAAGLFRHLDSPYATGILLAPHLPLEEIVFLLFLCQLTMVLLTGSGRLLERMRGRADAEQGGAPS